MAETKKKATGYDKYVDWRLFIIPVALFFIVLFVPTPYGMKDVGTEVKVGPKAVVNFVTMELFNEKSTAVDQWQLLTAQIAERNMRMGALSKKRFLQRNLNWCRKYDIPVDADNLKKAQEFVKKDVSDEAFLNMMKRAAQLRSQDLKYEKLSGEDKKLADNGAWHIKAAIAMVVFVVFCFMTECIPLPGVSFCVGLILVFTGVVTRQEVAMLYWDDAVWFIMGSLMTHTASSQ